MITIILLLFFHLSKGFVIPDDRWWIGFAIFDLATLGAIFGGYN